MAVTTIALTGTRRLGDQDITDRITRGARHRAGDLCGRCRSPNIPGCRRDDKRRAPTTRLDLATNTRNDYWKQWSIRDPLSGASAVPALNFAGWYDVLLKGGIENFTGMRARGGSEVARKNQKLMIAPSIHIPWTRKVGEIDFGPEADNQFDGVQLRWFDRWLKGVDNGIDPRAAGAGCS